MIFKALRRAPGGGKRDDAEKPFWISYSDLMTALMVLFMVAMAAALMVITQGVQRIERQKVERDVNLKACLDDIAALAAQQAYRGLAVRGNSVEFGSIAEFSRAGHDLPAERKDTIRRLMAGVLEVARSARCEAWIKNIVVDGYASQEGSYLLNLNLSLQRSQRMLCILLDARAPNALSEADRKFVRRKFLVGGSSFNAVKERPEESRRVEFRIDFRNFDEAPREGAEIPWDDDTRCPLDREKVG